MKIERGLIAILLMDNVCAGFSARFEQRVKQSIWLLRPHLRTQFCEQTLKLHLFSSLYLNDFKPADRLRRHKLVMLNLLTPHYHQGPTLLETKPNRALATAPA